MKVFGKQPRKILSTEIGSGSNRSGSKAFSSKPSLKCERDDFIEIKSRLK